jgi:hypothetical protein
LAVVVMGMVVNKEAVGVIAGSYGWIF